MMSMSVQRPKKRCAHALSFDRRSVTLPSNQLQRWRRGKNCASDRRSAGQRGIVHVCPTPTVNYAPSQQIPPHSSNEPLFSCWAFWLRPGTEITHSSRRERSQGSTSVASHPHRPSLPPLCPEQKKTTHTNGSAVSYKSIAA